MMKKTLALVLSFLIVISLFAGCGLKSETNSTTNSGTESTTSQSESNSSQTQTTSQSESKSSQTQATTSKKKAVPWDGTVATSYESGSGTSEDPYEIATAEQLALLAQQTNEGKVYSGMYYYLSNDIYLNSSSDVEIMAEMVSSSQGMLIESSDGIQRMPPNLVYIFLGYEDFSLISWTPIGTLENPFEGVFDGNGYTIYGLYSLDGNSYDLTSTFHISYNGLFGYMDGGKISNLNIYSAIIGIVRGGNETYETYCGAVVGYAEAGIIEKCSGDYVWIEGCTQAGGIAGGLLGDENNNISVSNCVIHSNCYINIASGRSGGVIGRADYCNIKQCFNYGYADCGIVGNASECKVYNCMSLGETSDYAIGNLDSYSKASSCYFANTSSVDGSRETGSAISATSEDNLRSFDWLVDNLGISDSIWYMSDGELYLK